MPFPFTLPGPEFALVFAAFAAALLLAAWWITDRWERARATRAALPTDPIEIACLRGGGAEAMRVAVLSLIDRNLIRYDEDADGTLFAIATGQRAASHPIERMVLGFLATPSLPEALITEERAAAVEALYEPSLAARGLADDTAMRRRRSIVYAPGGLVLTAIFAVRMAQAIAHHRYNVAFITITWIAFGVIASWMILNIRSGMAAAALASLRTLLAGLHERVATLRPGPATGELALLAAVFGFKAIPANLAPYARSLSLTMVLPVRKDGGGCGSLGGGDSSGSGCGGCGGGGGCGGD